MEKELTYYFKEINEFPFPKVFDGCIQPWEALLKVKELLKGKENYIGEGTKVHPSAEIVGPVWIGKNCEIGHAALIRPYTVIGDGCSVGHCSEIKHTIMMNGSKVASLALAGDSILGKSSRIGSGAITANRKFNQSVVKFNGEDLHSDFFGLILGDYSRLGANCVSQPGTHIGSYTWIYPMTNIRGFIPEKKRVYHEQHTLFEENEVIKLK